MYSYYLLYDPTFRQFAMCGHRVAMTMSMNKAKHFTSKWSAENWKKKSNMFDGCIIKRIESY